MTSDKDTTLPLPIGTRVQIDPNATYLYHAGRIATIEETLVQVINDEEILTYQLSLYDPRQGSVYFRTEFSLMESGEGVSPDDD